MITANRSLKIIALLFALSTTACAKSNSPTLVSDDARSAGIIGGSAVTSRDNVATKSVVHLDILKNGITVSGCSATLIDRETVLTAAHCLDGKRPFDTVYVEFTTKSANDKGRTVGIMTGFSLHPQYNTRGFNTFVNVLDKKNRWKNVPKVEMGVAYDHDIAVLVFRGQLPKDQAPIQIDTDTRANYAGEKIQAYGYGMSQDWSTEKLKEMEYSDLVKRKLAKPDPSIKAQVMDLHRGNFIVRNDFDSSSDAYHTVSDASTNTWTCQGDSGGPQFITKNGVTKQIGVNSTSDGPVVGSATIDGKPKVYKSCKGSGKAIRVAMFASWIQSARQRLMSDSKTDPRVQR